jgi:signal transduction histidine kinase
VPPADALPPSPQVLQRQIVAEMQLVPVPLAQRPRDTVLLGGPEQGRMTIGLRFPDGAWLTLRVELPAPRPWHSSAFLVAFAMMTAAAGLMSLWAVRRLTLPVATLASAAERLGRDVNAPPLPETGPEEIATAAAAFNTMAERIRRFVEDRTFMLAAIGHDLRTPITRLRLRAEFIDDDAVRGRMLADLDELEAMISATLHFGRDATAQEPPSRLDLAELVRTILDETADAMPEFAGELSAHGPDHLPIQARPIALKRAMTNLITNAAKYGGAARVTVGTVARGERGGSVTVLVDDDGPGIPQDDLERMFQPFQRLELSRNRETGGVGLGLPIARNIIRAHGGDVTLANRDGGGLRAAVVLPV